MRRLTAEEAKTFWVAGRIVKGTHNFKPMILSWPYCANCGLVLLKNEATRKAVKQPCIQLED